jgi:pantoate kinase
MNSAWAPSHATLFFAVPKKFDDPLAMGSIGGGFNFDEGVISEISPADQDTVLWNGNRITGKVTLTSLDLLRQKLGIHQFFTVRHISKIPIGYGLSTSGAGSISSLLAVCGLLNLEISDLELYKLAHRAELINHTGLGSVVGQVTSGIEIRLSQGAPGLCKTRSFSENDDVVILIFGPLKTSAIITSEEIMISVTKAGLEAVEKAKNIKNNYTTQLIKIGNEFTRKCGLPTLRLREVMKELDELGEDLNAMAMIGETIIIVPRDHTKLIKWIETRGYDYIESKISSKKPHMIRL